MEKKIEVERESDGKIIRVMPHMLSDVAKFGAREIKRQTKKPPEELQSKKIILPATDKITEDPIIQNAVAPDLELKETAKTDETAVVEKKQIIKPAVKRSTKSKAK